MSDIRADYVRGGLGRFQGTYVDFEEAIQICLRYDLKDLAEYLLQTVKNHSVWPGVPAGQDPILDHQGASSDTSHKADQRKSENSTQISCFTEPSYSQGSFLQPQPGGSFLVQFHPDLGHSEAAMSFSPIDDTTMTFSPTDETAMTFSPVDGELALFDP